jgi:hypothetical protein
MSIELVTHSTTVGIAFPQVQPVTRLILVTHRCEYSASIAGSRLDPGSFCPGTGLWDVGGHSEPALNHHDSRRDGSAISALQHPHVSAAAVHVHGD